MIYSWTTLTFVVIIYPHPNVKSKHLTKTISHFGPFCLSFDGRTRRPSQLQDMRLNNLCRIINAPHPLLRG